ncbi:MAG: hydroxyethylthiazole kinase [Nocardioides sp.]|nr:hydroxyethylthiazole kinase [Nocardioides sp.]
MMRTHVDWLQSADELLPRVRETQPLVQCLTNSVTTNFVANALLAVGASPAMVDIPEEAGLLARSAGALLVNLGTPSGEQREAMLEAATAANDAATPWVLDPVGVGALPIRTELAQRLAGLRPTVIRGNASEIRALAGHGAGGKGVDASDEVDDARSPAVELAQSTGAVIAVSGAVDLITDGHTVVRIANGDPLFTKITGAGCALGAVIAAFAAVGDDYLAAAVAACAAYGIAGEFAAHGADRPGSFAVALLDSLSAIDGPAVVERGRLS